MCVWKWSLCACIRLIGLNSSFNYSDRDNHQHTTINTAWCRQFQLIIQYLIIFCFLFYEFDDLKGGYKILIISIPSSFNFSIRLCLQGMFIYPYRNLTRIRWTNTNVIRTRTLIPLQIHVWKFDASLFVKQSFWLEQKREENLDIEKSQLDFYRISIIKFTLRFFSKQKSLRFNVKSFVINLSTHFFHVSKVEARKKTIVYVHVHKWNFCRVWIFLATE